MKINPIENVPLLNIITKFKVLKDQYIIVLNIQWMSLIIV